MADRAAGLTTTEGDRPSPDAYVQAFVEWLEQDPSDTPEARAQRRLDEIMEAA